MTRMMLALLGCALVAPAAAPAQAMPADTASFVMRDFHFASGETLAEVRIHYRTLGRPRMRPGGQVGSSRVDLQACKLEYSIVSPK